MKTKIKIGIGVAIILVVLGFVFGQSELFLGRLGPFEIKKRAVSISLATPPISRSAWANESVSVIGFTIKNNSRNEITVNKVSIRLFADRDGNFGPEGFGDVPANSFLKSIRLSERINTPPFAKHFAETSLFSPVQSGNKTYYQAEFSHITQSIPRFTSKTLVVTVQFKNPSETRYLAAGFIIGEKENDIVIVDQQGKSVQISKKRINIAKKPKIVITITPSPERDDKNRGAATENPVAPSPEIPPSQNDQSAKNEQPEPPTPKPVPKPHFDEPVLGDVPTFPEEPLWDETNLISVEEFGAYGKSKGDSYFDPDDDSDAFQKAADDSSKLYIPAGVYFLTKPIAFRGPTTLVSDGKAIIHQKCATCSIFTFEGGYPIRIRGLKFAHGTRQLVINNSGKAGTYVSIHDAEFQGATDFSIYANDPLTSAPQSTLLIAKSKFEGDTAILRNIFGKTFIVDTVATPCFKKDDTAAFVNQAGALVFDNFFSVPGCLMLGGYRVKNARWVDNHDQFFAFHSRFGGEKAGVAIVHHFKGDVIRIEDSAISAGGSNEGSGVVVLRGPPPRLTRIIGNNNIVDTYYFRPLPADLEIPDSLDARIEIEPNVFAYDKNAVPALKPFLDLLEPFRKHPKKQKGIAPIVTASPQIIPPKNDLSFIDVAEFGALGNDDRDDTDAIQAAANQYTESRGHLTDESTKIEPTKDDRSGDGGVPMKSAPILYFPPGLYMISDEIKLNGSANVVGNGAIIRQTNPKKRIFVMEFAYGMPTIRGIRFEGGTHQIDVRQPNVGGTTITIEDSEFVDASEYAIYTLGTAAEDAHMSPPLFIYRSKFINPRKVLHNTTDVAVIRNSEIHLGDKFENDSAAIENRYGYMYLNNVKARGPSRETARWIDNYENVFIANSDIGSLGPTSSVIHHFGEHIREWPYYGRTVIVKDSSLPADPNSPAGILTLRKGVPRMIRFTGNTYPTKDPSYLRVQGFNIDEYFKEGNLKQFYFFSDLPFSDLTPLEKFVTGE